MNYVRNNSYRDISFSSGTPYNDFYTYSDLNQISDKCMIGTDDMIIKCRTIGILQTQNGRFYLTDIDAPMEQLEPRVQVSVVYLKSPLRSTVIPYPVQVFGSLQWKNRPVIFANIIQVMTVSTAIRVRNALRGITSIHLATNIPDLDDDVEEGPT